MADAGTRGSRFLELLSRLLKRFTPSIHLIQHRPSFYSFFQKDEVPRAPTASALTLLPTELLLHIASFLPVENAVCLALTTKYFHSTLSTEIDMTLPNPEQKNRFLRLLERDFPQLLTCRTCNILYRWNRWFRSYECPRHDQMIERHYGAVPYCSQHVRSRVPTEVVDAFIRGFQYGPRYGPQLVKLFHSCVYLSGPEEIRWSLEARAVDDKLILHSTYKLHIVMPESMQYLSRLDEPEASHVLLGIPKEVSRAVNALYFVGCPHAPNRLPAVIVDALQDSYGPSNPSRRCHGLLHCERCATDLRVKIVEGDALRVGIVVSLWHCLGGRVIGQRLPSEDLLFDWRSLYVSDSSVHLRRPVCQIATLNKSTMLRVRSCAQHQCPQVFAIVGYSNGHGSTTPGLKTPARVSHREISKSGNLCQTDREQHMLFGE